MQSKAVGVDFSFVNLVEVNLVKPVNLVNQPTSKPGEPGEAGKPGEGESANKTLSGASGSSFLAPLLWSVQLAVVTIAILTRVNKLNNMVLSGLRQSWSF